jgi:phage/plasmid-like protein (TIGR03299 family)
MSRETSLWLNTQTLIGFTEMRGRAWHYRENDQDIEPNHYPLAIPVEDVRRRLFGWKVVEGDASATGTILTEDGVETFTIIAKNRKSMLRPPRTFGDEDEGDILGYFKSGYQGHDYEKWLLNQVAAILDDELQIGSAGLLKGGAQAWVSVEVPENITTPEGVVFRPHLLATTSFDGSLSTTYKRVVTNVVCDNTMAAGLGEQGQQFKVQHSRYSEAKLAGVRDALELVHTIADDFAAEVAALTSTKVTDGDWAQFLDTLAPLAVDGEAKEGRALTMAQNKRDELAQLWNNDERVAPWHGTAFGVLQAVNTHAHHIQTVRGAERAERNMAMAVSGGFDKLDTETMSTLGAILA